MENQKILSSTLLKKGSILNHSGHFSHKIISRSEEETGFDNLAKAHTHIFDRVTTNQGKIREFFLAKIKSGNFEILGKIGGKIREFEFS